MKLFPYSEFSRGEDISATNFGYSFGINIIGLFDEDSFYKISPKASLED